MYGDPSKFIARADLVDRQPYRLTARNLSIGVWDAEVGCFIGIRRKFGSEYLDTEHLYEDLPDNHGTAAALEAVGEVVPPTTAMDTWIGRVDGLQCRTVREVVINGKSEYHYTDTFMAIPEGVKVITVWNESLMQLLAELAEEAEHDD